MDFARVDENSGARPGGVTPAARKVSAKCGPDGMRGLGGSMPSVGKIPSATRLPLGNISNLSSAKGGGGRQATATPQSSAKATAAASVRAPTIAGLDLPPVERAHPGQLAGPVRLDTSGFDVESAVQALCVQSTLSYGTPSKAPRAASELERPPAMFEPATPTIAQPPTPTVAGRPAAPPSQAADAGSSAPAAAVPPQAACDDDDDAELEFDLSRLCIVREECSASEQAIGAGDGESASESESDMELEEKEAVEGPCECAIAQYL